MHQRRLDILVRSLGHSGTRRTTVWALLTAIVVPLLPDAAEGKRGRGRARVRKKRTGSGKKRRGDKRAGDHGGQRIGAEASCYPGSPCVPGPGKNLGRCDFSDSPTLQNKILKGANLGGATVARGDASGANLHGANLDKACLVDTILTGAKVNGSTNIASAILCRTTMPDGSINNSGCSKGTNCCPTCDADNPCGDGEVCCNGRCRPGECCDHGDCRTNEQCCAGECISSTVCCTAGGPSCTAGKDCLSNGSCGTPCNGDTCAPGCGCSLPNAEGDRYCAAFLPECPNQTCSSTSECPAGTMCHNSGTPSCPQGQFLCWPMCAAPSEE